MKESSGLKLLCRKARLLSRRRLLRSPDMGSSRLLPVGPRPARASLVGTRFRPDMLLVRAAHSQMRQASRQDNRTTP